MKKILIIEDDHATSSQLAQLLRFEGFEAIEANSGKIGVTTAIATIPDLIVCDIMMPELDGFGVIQALREEPRTMNIPFIFLTAKSSSSDQRLGMEEGADDYMTKPYSPDALLNSIRRRLAKRTRQLEETQKKAEEVSLAVTASVPEEILSTLDRITTATGLIAHKYADDDVQVSSMHFTVLQEASRLRSMMRRLHVFAHLPQLYENRFELANSDELPNTGEILAHAAQTICNRWHRVDDLSVNTMPCRIRMRSDYFTIIVEELVDNACKFSEQGTPIDVTGCATPAFWSLTVSNQGTTMTESQIKQIAAFKQFWTGTKKPRGLGLGLALTQGIARLHGSEFTIHSTDSETIATVMIPFETVPISS